VPLANNRAANAVEGNDASESAVIRELAANDEENAVADVVRRHYAAAGQRLKRLPKLPSSGSGVRSLVVPSTNTDQPDRTLVAPLIERRRSVQLPSFHALQEWEGVVSAINSTTMIADLVDLSAGNQQATEQVEIDLDELSHEDRDNLRLGAVFRWAIGYVTKPGTPKQRTSQIVFRQLPVWSRADLDAANRCAAERQCDIHWE
jgi:hypothetical protein